MSALTDTYNTLDLAEQILDTTQFESLLNLVNSDLTDDSLALMPELYLEITLLNYKHAS